VVVAENPPPPTPHARGVESGEFRDDLYYRLNVVNLHIPPLRERRDDIGALVAHFARQAAQRLGRPVSITPRALAMLADYAWPGNIRELRNAIERAAVLGAAGRLDLVDFPLSASSNGNGHANGNGNGTGHANGNGHANANGHANGTGYTLKPQVEALERVTIVRALEASRGSRREAAQLLGVSLRTLFYKLRRYELE
jgi:DNA-binding NtrC family response regulator